MDSIKPLQPLFAIISIIWVACKVVGPEEEPVMGKPAGSAPGHNSSAASASAPPVADLGRDINHQLAAILAAVSNLHSTFNELFTKLEFTALLHSLDKLQKSLEPLYFGIPKGTILLLAANFFAFLAFAVAFFVAYRAVKRDIAALNLILAGMNPCNCGPESPPTAPLSTSHITTIFEDEGAPAIVDGSAPATAEQITEPAAPSASPEPTQLASPESGDEPSTGIVAESTPEQLEPPALPPPASAPAPRPASSHQSHSGGKVILQCRFCGRNHPDNTCWKPHHCERCGESGHIESKCHYKFHNCGSCQQRGHLESRCPAVLGVNGCSQARFFNKKLTDAEMAAFSSA